MSALSGTARPRTRRAGAPRVAALPGATEPHRPMGGRVLFTCFPGYGHLNPLLPLARAYRAAGAEVQIATGPEICAEVIRQGFAALAVGPTEKEIGRRFRAQAPDLDLFDPMGLLAEIVRGMFAGVGARARLADLSRACQDFRPELIVHDAVDFAAPVVAARWSVPAVTHGVTLQQFTGTLADKTLVALDELWREAGAPGQARAFLDHPYLDVCPPSLAQGGPSMFPDRRPIATVARAAAEPAPDLARRLDRLPHSRTVHVTLGTVVNATPGLLATLVGGAALLDVNVVATVGPGRDPAVLGKQPSSVLVDSYIPHAALLARCDAVVSHAGAGTLLTTLAHGLPSLLAPVATDQAPNAALAAAAGVAAVLRLDGLTPDTVAAALQRVLDDSTARIAARRVQEDIASMPSPEEVRAGLAEP